MDHLPPHNLPPALEIRGLRKSFARPAVDGLDLNIRAGEFYMLLGPNGAGKTTTLRMVSGLMQPDAGAISVFGIDAMADPVSAKRIMGWLSDEPMIYDKLTPLEYLEFVAGLERPIARRSPGRKPSSRDLDQQCASVICMASRNLRIYGI